MRKEQKQRKHQPINKKIVEDIVALTPIQEGMLYHYLLDLASDQYFEQFSYRIGSPLDIPACIEAWNWTIGQNQALRTVFRWSKIESPVQVILKERLITYTIHDLSLLNAIDKEEKVKEICQNDRQKPMSLSEGPLFRVIIFKLLEGHYIMTLSNHHIIFDGWSNGIILTEFMDTYNKMVNGIQPKTYSKLPLKKYIKWIKARRKEGEELFWKKYFKNYEFSPIIESLSIKGINQMNIEEESHTSLCETYTLSPELMEGIEEVAKKENVTLSSIFTLVWGMLLQKYSQRDDVIFGTTVSGRSGDLAGIENIVGLLMNTIPVRVMTKPGITLGELLQVVHGQAVQCKTYELTPLVEIQNHLDWQSKASLFETLLVVENYPLNIDRESILQIDDFVGYSVTNYSILVSVNCFKSTSIKFVYNSRDFHEEFIKIMCNRFVYLLELIVSNSKYPVDEIEFFTIEESLLDIELDYEFKNMECD